MKTPILEEFSWRNTFKVLIPLDEATQISQVLFEESEDQFSSTNAWISLLLIKDRKKVNKILDIKIKSLYKEPKRVIHLKFLKAIF